MSGRAGERRPHRAEQALGRERLREHGTEIDPRQSLAEALDDTLARADVALYADQAIGATYMTPTAAASAAVASAARAVRRTTRQVAD
ncbi:hypothetical protein J421_5515 (plasmid) [Gemmatirosa kalamazoonensis]|uniref:Uncharacterized protein n=1 Tax=Gemmatirosa kalamazoonensis TaxID=861299 RepID=W0RRU3_9BACT|nr:hypothetical protein J421_5515 [Gemmatirosa kalamazoonensis]